MHIKIHSVALLVGFFFLTINPTARAADSENPRYLIQQWQAAEGVPENSALAVAQTKDGYIWVGSTGGLLRFNGYEFIPAKNLYDFPMLGNVVVSLHTDRAARLWVSTSVGLAVLEQGVWRAILNTNVIANQIVTGKTNVVARTLAMDVAGRVFVGTFEGELFQVLNYELQRLPPPEGLVKSGVFCIADEKDGGMWVANRGFIGRWTETGWERLGPEMTQPTTLATAARGGGIWVYSPGTIRCYHAAGVGQTLPAQTVDQPRELHEDRNGRLWLASNASGVQRLEPDGSWFSITANNPLAHNSARCVVEDVEGNLWVGTSSGGLQRVRQRQIFNVGPEEGLPDRIIRTVTEEIPGRMLVGTHGSGTARIENGKATWLQAPVTDPNATYVWSVLCDRKGRVWMGAFSGGLHLEEQGVKRPFPLPTELGQSVYSLFEDSQGRVWVGTGTGLGVIENGVARVWSTNTALFKAGVRCLAEEPKTGALWAGTYERGLYWLNSDQWTRFGRAEGLPSERICSVHVDDDGCVWAGVFGAGLVRIRDGKISGIDQTQGLPTGIIGSMLDDGLGNFWLGTDQGIVRVTKAALHGLAEGRTPEAHFDLFNRNDGMGDAQCADSYQPAAARDSAGKLWFATLKGVAYLDPRTIQVNTNPPPVCVEQIGYKDHTGAARTLLDPGPKTVHLPAGSTEIEVRCAALSYAVPEKVNYAFRFEGADSGWVNLRQRRTFYFHSLDPGSYRLQIKASNNDGLWNETGATLSLMVSPFFWQTFWFRLLLGALGVTVVAGSVWWVTHTRLRQQIEKAEQERAAEEALRLSEQRYRHLYESMTDAYASVDMTGRIVESNAAFQKLVGYSEADLMQLTHRDLTPARWHDFEAKVVTEQVIAHGHSDIYEKEYQHKNGQVFPIELRAFLILNETRQATGIWAIVRDISERKKRDAALQKLASAFPSLSSGEFFYRVSAYLAEDLNVEYVFVGELAPERRRLRLLGGSSHGKSMPPLEYDLSGTPCEHALTESFCAYPKGLQQQFPQDKLLVEMQAEGYLGTALFDRKQQPVGLLVAISRRPLQDVARAQAMFKLFSGRIEAEIERQRAEAELTRNEERFRSLIENASDLILVLNKTGLIRFASPSVERVMGYPPTEMIGKDGFEFIHTDDVARVRHSLENVRTAPGTSLRFTLRMRHQNRQWRLVEVVGRSLPDATEDGGVILNARDLTEGAKLEEQLRQSQKMEAIGKLSGGVAHDFNNILTVIQGHVTLLLTQEGQPPDTVESLNEIAQSADRAANLTRQLLAFSRRQLLQRTTLNLNEVVANTTRMLKRILGEDMVMQLHYAPQPPVILADANMLEQVLLNLVVNARDALPKGGRLLIETGHIEIDEVMLGQMPQARSGHFVTLSVTDSGSGIAPEILPHIFEPFFTTKGVGAGTGLGLATVYGIVQQHQGWINVYSESGQGTTFRIYFPRQETLPTNTAPPANSWKEAQGGSETILVVEDEPALRTLVCRVLSRLGYKIIEAPSGAKALGIWAQHRDEIQLLLTDMVMPEGLGGRELAERLLAERPEVKVIYSSGYSPEVTARDFPLQEGVNFISKPYEPLKLAQIIRARLDA